jgi:predicted aminopeptidase
VYVTKAALAEIEILGDRRPIDEVVLDPGTDERTRGILTLVREAQAFATDELGLDAGGSYTSFTQLKSDTLALVLSAAYPDRLAPKTWWFPVVGHVPYRGFFDEGDARRAQTELESEGLDTYLRPTAAFSTLGWFDDPLLSSILRGDEIEVVTTVFHEMSHAHLFVPGQVGFNESYATFVGRAAAVEFFCSRPGAGPDSLRCLRAQARWRDVRRFSRFLDELVAELEEIYGDPALASSEKIARREGVFRRAQERFRFDVAPGLESLTFASFGREPINNATLLSRIRYYRRLPDFGRLVHRHGSLREAVVFLVAGAGSAEDPFELLGDAPVIRGAANDPPLPGETPAP